MSSTNNDELASIKNFEIDETIEWIKLNDFKKVGLQFPNELLPVSIQISLELKKGVSCQFGIMADTSYANCCVDEVGGEHYSVEAIVHYGNACLTPTQRKLPVKYIFGNYTFDKNEMDNAVDKIKFHLNNEFGSEIINRNITILFDFKYLAYSEFVEEKLKNYGYCIYNSFPNLPKYSHELLMKNYKTFGSRIIESNIDNNYENIVLYIGDNNDDLLMTCMLSIHHLYKIMFLFSPCNKEIQNISSKFDMFLKKRRFSIQVATTTRRVGLLVGTLSIENYLEIYNYLYDIMRKSGKIVYPMVVGKINENKLFNFNDLDAVVIINCPESCLRFSNRNDAFFKHVITPYEMVCACDQEKFANWYVEQYFTDFKDLLKTENLITSFNNDESAFSLYKLQSQTCSVKETVNGNTKELVARLDSDWSVAAIPMSTRSWFGLDPLLGHTEVSEIKDGKSGIAATYENEIN